VDDTYVVQTKLNDYPTDAISQLQSAMGTWEKSLKVSCGAIALEKTV
jgi:hypothetical protein